MTPSQHRDEQTYREHPEELYGDAFFKRAGRSRHWQILMGMRFVEVFHPKSVADFGCGCGYYLDGAFAKGVRDLLGVEYMLDFARPYVSSDIINSLRPGDLNKPFSEGRVFDLVISTEVAEHLLPEGSQNFVDTIARHLAPGGHFIFSASNDPEAGTGHINARPMSFWEGLFGDHGITPNKEATGWVHHEFNIVKGFVSNPYLRHMARSVVVMSRG